MNRIIWPRGRFAETAALVLFLILTALFVLLVLRTPGTPAGEGWRWLAAFMEGWRW